MENCRIYNQIYEPVPYLVIENTFNDDELALIWGELEFLNQPGKLTETDSAELDATTEGSEGR